MRTIFLIFVLIMTYSLSADIKLVKVTGTVQVKKDSSAQWKGALSGDILNAGSFIFTGFNSTAVIEYNSIKIEVKPLSQACIASLIVNEKKCVSDIYLKYGKVRADIKKIGSVKTDFSVRSANSTASVRGTGLETGDNELYVEYGGVRFESDSFKSIFVTAGESAFYSDIIFEFITQQQILLKKYYPDVRPLGLFDDDLFIDDYDDGSIGNGKSELIIKVRVKR